MTVIHHPSPDSFITECRQPRGRLPSASPRLPRMLGLEAADVLVLMALVAYTVLAVAFRRRVAGWHLLAAKNLVAALVTQAQLYERMSGDGRYREFAARHRDWLLGCNPWAE